MGRIGCDYAAEWMPIPAARCQYLGERVAGKLRWELSVDETERDALLRHACECPNRELSYEAAA